MKTLSLFLITALLFGSVASPYGFAKRPTVGVIYPSLREPYRSVFKNIVDGIEADSAYRVVEYVLRKNEQPTDVMGWLQKNDIELVTALGSRGLEIAIAQEISETVKVVFGAVLIPPESLPAGAKGIALTPDPKLLFTHLKKLTPHINKITVVYNPKHFEWLIRLAHSAASDVDVELSALAVENFRDAATRYREFFDSNTAESNAVWLLQDPSIIDERTILKLILEEAWKKKLVVFSSNPSHVKKGILFSLYPDNVRMGNSLSQIMRAVIEHNGGEYPPISPARDLLTAVNLRTAEHLGLKLSRSQKRQFTLVFPTR